MFHKLIGLILTTRLESSEIGLKIQIPGGLVLNLGPVFGKPYRSITGFTPAPAP